MKRKANRSVLARTFNSIIAAFTLAAVGGAPAFAQDWNQWRGPDRAAHLTGFKAPSAWPAQLTKKWSVPVGEGHSSPLVVGDSVYVFAREGDNEITRRLNLATGKEMWRDSYAAPYTMNPAARGHGKGPKSTPVYADGRLYTLGITGTLSCLDAKTGKILWRSDFTKDYKQTSPAFGTAMSPIVEKGLLIAHVGGQDDGALTAFDAKTGQVKWKWTGDGPGYSSPVVVTLDGTRQVITQTQKMCVALDAATGKLLWSLPFTTPYEQNSVTPVPAGDFIVFGGHQKPTFAVRPKKSGDTWTAEKVWETPEVTLYMSTGVVSGGRLYGMSQKQRGQMFSLDLATGKVLWTGEERFGENASVWDAGNSILALNTGADLLVFKKDGDGLTQTAKYTVADSAVWASPAFTAKGILVKDFAGLTLWELP
jgi:outer membrane protein assembly factor BamB